MLDASGKENAHNFIASGAGPSDRSCLHSMASKAYAIQAQSFLSWMV